MIKIRPKDKPWITHEVKQSIRRRNYFFCRFKKTCRPEHEATWKRVANETNFIMHQAKMAHTNKIKNQLMDLTVGEKKYWKIAKEVYGSKKIIGIPSLTVQNKSISTSIEKAKCMNEYFAEQQT